jgi:uncharacterized membrane protein
MRKWTSVVPVLGAYALSAAVFSRLPSEARPDFSPLLPFHAAAAAPVPRLVIALLIPTLALAVWVVLTFLAKVVSRDAIQRFEPTYETVVFSVTSLIALMHVVFVVASLGWPSSIYQLATAIVGLGFIAVGNVMPRVRPNWIAGLRTKRTLSDPAAWASTHRLLGALMIGVGAMVVVLSIIAPRYALAAAFAALLASFVLAHLFGTRVQDSKTMPVL